MRRAKKIEKVEAVRLNVGREIFGGVSLLGLDFGRKNKNLARGKHVSFKKVERREARKKKRQFART